jgi:hypothetical protein
LAVVEKALKIAQEEEVTASILNNIALTQANASDATAAVNTCQKALALDGISPFMRAQLTATLARVFLDAAEQDASVENSEKAAFFAQKSLDLFGKTTDPRAKEKGAAAQLGAGRAALQLGRLAEAEQMLRAALAQARAGQLPPRDLAKFELAWAQCCAARGRPAEAMSTANHVLGILMPDFRPAAAAQNPDPRLFYPENSIFEALEAKALAAEALFEKNKDAAWASLALACHDLAWQAERTLREALQYQSSKLNLQQNIRRREEAAMRVLRRLYELRPDPALALRALQVAERSKANLLWDALQDNLVRQQLRPNDPTFGKLHALRQNMALLEREEGNRHRVELDALRSEAAVLEAQIARDYPNLSLAQGEPAGLDFSMLDDGELALVYFAEGTWLHVFVLDGQGISAWGKIEIHGEISNFLDFFKNPTVIANDPEGYKSAAFRLFSRLFPTGMPVPARLCVVPDAALCFVPFEALLTADCAACGLKEAPYLIRQCVLRYAFSLRTLAQQRGIRGGASEGLLAFAPRFARGERGLAPLSAEQDEWADFGFLNTKAYVGEAATTALFLQKAPVYDVLHLSTHVRAGERPCIEFYDRSFYLPEVYALALRAGLVVLSACETGIGVEQRGEGVMSLARAFAQAGAPSIVSSLWSVNDRSTAVLFGRFYAQLRGGEPVGQALCTAKLAYLNDSKVAAAFQTPYFWAGFVVVGDNRAVDMGSGWMFWALAGGVLLVGLLVFMFQKKLKSVNF